MKFWPDGVLYFFNRPENWLMLILILTGKNLVLKYLLGGLLYGGRLKSLTMTTFIKAKLKKSDEH